MQNSLLLTLRRLKKALHDGEISSAEYAERRQAVLDDFVPSEEEEAVKSDNHTMSELLEPRAEASEPMEEANTITVLLEAGEFDEDDNTGAHFLGDDLDS